MMLKNYRSKVLERCYKMGCRIQMAGLVFEGRIATGEKAEIIGSDEG